MSLSPSTDLVLEVSHAADPARAAAVTQRLNALSNDGAGSPQDFATALDHASATPASAPSLRAAPSREARMEKARTQLESVFLSQFLEETLPKDSPAFGQGFAGDQWRSLLAQKVADQMAASGRLGIASKLFSAKALAGAPAAEAAHSQTFARAVQTSPDALSLPSGAEVEGGSALFAKSPTL